VSNNSQRGESATFIFADDQMLDKYVEQCFSRFVLPRVDKKVMENVCLAYRVPCLEASRTTERVPLKTHQKIDFIEAFLEKTGAIFELRDPQKLKNLTMKMPRGFVVESIVGNKKFCSQSQRPDLVRGLFERLAIWVFLIPNPTLVQFAKSMIGAAHFFISPNFRWDNLGASNYLSGVSALQAIVNLSRGKENSSILSQGEFEPFGREVVTCIPLTSFRKINWRHSHRQAKK